MNTATHSTGPRPDATKHQLLDLADAIDISIHLVEALGHLSGSGDEKSIDAIIEVTGEKLEAAKQLLEVIRGGDA